MIVREDIGRTHHRRGNASNQLRMLKTIRFLNQRIIWTKRRLSLNRNIISSPENENTPLIHNDVEDESQQV
ncbi:unnamed protein product [Rhizophagus irregularis]|nr:unnamed protein product [Rhizophagus irregularis]